MTYLVTPHILLYLVTMAILLFGDVNLLLLVVILISGNNYYYIKPKQHSSSFAEAKKVITLENAFYQKCEEVIKQELATFSEADLVKEVKLAGMSNTIGGATHFYPLGGKVNSPLFSWQSRTNPYMMDDYIVIGVSDRRVAEDPNMPFGWMTGAYIALRKMSTSGPSSFLHMINYYALVAYVRKDSNGTGEVVEWDRFSPKVVKHLYQKESETEAAEGFSIETLLCAYGTCACAACSCDSASRNQRVNKQEDDYVVGGAGFGREKHEGEGYSFDYEPNPPAMSPPTPPPPSYASGEAVTKPTKKRKFNGVTAAIASSKKGNAKSKAEASKKDEQAYSQSKSETGSAVAESYSHKGGSSSYAEGKNDSLAESTGSGKDGTVSKSVTKDGVAQASSHGRGGNIEAQAVRVGEDGAEYNYYDENRPSSEESDEDFDGRSLVRETNKKFQEVNERAAKMKQQEDMCVVEWEYEVNITNDEFKTTMETKKFKEESKRLKKGEQLPLYAYKNPLRFGVDVETGVNSSVLIATIIPGFVVPRASCCGLESSPVSVIYSFLRTFRQDCNGDLETQVKRLETSFSDYHLHEMMKERKLGLFQLRDLVPMVLMSINQQHTTRKTVKQLKKAFNNTASAHINKIVAIILHSAHFAMTDGYLHKVKIMKGLVMNVRTVLTGVLLEFKKCKKSTATDCSEGYQERLKTEKRMLYALYYYLKFVDSRYAYFKVKPEKPGRLFASFVKTHAPSISKLVYCKSRRIIMNSA